ncbi:MAG: hypothetical protein ACLFR2_06775 [Candidatus Kapaibacterium sp.]
MAIFRITIIALLLFTTVKVMAQDRAQGAVDMGEAIAAGEAPEELNIKIKRFFNLIRDEKIFEAYDKILNLSPLSEKKDKIRRLIAETEKAMEVYGSLLDFEPVMAERVTDSFFKLHYLGLHADYPVRWIFTYYRSPERGWIVTNLRFDDLSEFYFD